MKRGDNVTTIALTTEILNVVRLGSGRERQNYNDWLVKLALEHKTMKKLFREVYGDEAKEQYEKAYIHFSKTNLQRKKEREAKEKTKQLKEELKERIEKIKTYAYATQSGVEVDEDLNLIDKENLQYKLESLKDRGVIKVSEMPDHYQINVIANLGLKDVEKIRELVKENNAEFVTDKILKIKKQ